MMSSLNMDLGAYKGDSVFECWSYELSRDLLLFGQTPSCSVENLQKLKG